MKTVGPVYKQFSCLPSKKFLSDNFIAQKWYFSPENIGKNQLSIIIVKYFAAYFLLKFLYIHTSEVELFVKTVNDLKPLKAVIAKRSTLGI